MEPIVLDTAAILQLLSIVVILATVFKVYTNIMVQLTKLEGRISNIEVQYRPNGGSSMRDAINRIEKRLTKFETDLDNIVMEDEE